MKSLYWDDGSEMSLSSFYDLLEKNYWLTNYRPGRMDILSRSSYGGSVGYITGPLADKLGKQHDPWNWNIHNKKEEQHERT